MNYKILWKHFPEINKLRKEEINIYNLTREIDHYLTTEDTHKLSLKILEFLKEILTKIKQNYKDIDRLNEELYWFRFSFLKGDDETTLVISKEVFSIFFDFYPNPKYNKLIKKIDILLYKNIVNLEF